MALSGPVQTRVFDFLRILVCLRTDHRMGRRVWSFNPLTVALDKGYVPRTLVGRGSIQKKRETAIAYMEYVSLLLKNGGFSKQYGEEIVMGWITYAGIDSGCGNCPSYSGTAASNILSATESGVICVCEEGEQSV